jgi:uncharacterized protein (DUF305 family)
MKRLLAAAILTFVPITLAGCSSGVDHSSHSMPSNSSSFSADEIMFAQMMIPHHQQALDMVAIAETKTTDKDILHVSGHIKDAQAPEVATMKSWLTEAGASIEPHHSMEMDGMLTDAEMAELENATGEEFERLFLSGMIKHHQGALDMLYLLDDSTKTEVTSFGDMIRKVQSKEITEMQTMLKKY